MSQSGTDGEPSLKRSRPNETRDADLYFEDGSIVLSAKDPDGDLVFFRVHKSVLKKNSTILKDMLSIPEPSNLETYDSVPLVNLPDSANDLRGFLKAMYDPRLQCDTPEIISGPLRLATKYEAKAIRHRIISHLEAEWPNTLESWDDLTYGCSDRKTQASCETDAASPSDGFDDDEIALSHLFLDPAPFIPISRECQLSSISATLFYCLCLQQHRLEREPSSLSCADWVILMVGKDRMMNYISSSAKETMGVTSWELEKEQYSGSYTDNLGRCFDAVFCTGRLCRVAVLIAWLKVVENIVQAGDPLKSLKTKSVEFHLAGKEWDDEDSDWSYGGMQRDEMCSHCIARFADNLRMIRQNFFNELPSFFGLPKTIEGDDDYQE